MNKFWCQILHQHFKQLDNLLYRLSCTKNEIEEEEDNKKYFTLELQHAW